MKQQFNNRLYTTPSRELSSTKPRFIRQKTPSPRSSPSKSSQMSPINQKFIKFQKIIKNQLDPDEFFSGFSKEMVEVRSNEQKKSPKKYQHGRENSIIKMQTLEAKLNDSQSEKQRLLRQNTRIKQALDKQIEKRKIADKKLKQVIIEETQYQKKCRELQIANNSLKKQVKYLQDTKLSKQERIFLSYRQKALMEQINRVKNQSLNGLNANILFLDKQIKRINQQNQYLKNQNKLLRIAQGTIMIRLINFKKQLKEAAKLEIDYMKLKEKYDNLSAKQREERRQLQRQMRKKGKNVKKNQDILDISSSSSDSQFVANLMISCNLKKHSRGKPNGL